NLIVVEAAPAHLRRRWISGLHSMYGIAALWAPFTASFFRTEGWTWRHCFFALAFLPMGTMAVAARFKTKSASAKSLTHLPLSRREWRLCLLFSVMCAFYLWGEISVSSRMVLWLRTDLGFAADRADLYLGGFFMAMLSGRVLFSMVHLARLGNW